MLPLLQFALLIAFPALAIVAGMRDATSFTIPNWISLALIGLFFPTALILGAPLSDIGLSVAVGIGALVVGMGMFAAGWIGGGDAKLFAAVALWLGWSALLPFLAVTAIAGGGLALSLLVVRSGWLRPMTARLGGWIGRLTTPGENVPYGVAIAAGALAAFPMSVTVQLFPGLS